MAKQKQLNNLRSHLYHTFEKHFRSSPTLWVLRTEVWSAFCDTGTLIQTQIATQMKLRDEWPTEGGDDT